MFDWHWLENARRSIEKKPEAKSLPMCPLMIGERTNRLRSVSRRMFRNWTSFSAWAQTMSIIDCLKSFSWTWWWRREWPCCLRIWLYIWKKLPKRSSCWAMEMSKASQRRQRLTREWIVDEGRRDSVNSGLWLSAHLTLFTSWFYEEKRNRYFFLSRNRDYRRWNERIILWWSFTRHGKMKIAMNQLIVIQQWQPLEREKKSSVNASVSLLLLLNNRWGFPLARFLSVDNWCVKRWRTNDGSRREQPEDEFWFHRRTTAFSNDREQEDTLLWSVLVPTICRRWPAKQRSLLLRPSAESSRRRFSPRSNSASLNSTDSTRADRDREDSDRMCEVKRCLAKETRVILWSVVEYRPCTASSDSVEDRDNNRRCHPDESDWIPNESSLDTRRSFFLSFSERRDTDQE